MKHDNYNNKIQENKPAEIEAKINLEHWKNRTRNPLKLPTRLN